MIKYILTLVILALTGAYSGLAFAQPPARSAGTNDPTQPPIDYSMLTDNEIDALGAGADESPYGSAASTEAPELSTDTSTLSYDEINAINALLQEQTPEEQAAEEPWDTENTVTITEDDIDAGVIAAAQWDNDIIAALETSTTEVFIAGDNRMLDADGNVVGGLSEEEITANIESEARDLEDMRFIEAYDRQENLATELADRTVEAGTALGDAEAAEEAIRGYREIIRINEEELDAIIERHGVLEAQIAAIDGRAPGYAAEYAASRAHGLSDGRTPIMMGDTIMGYKNSTPSYKGWWHDNNWQKNLIALQVVHDGGWGYKKYGGQAGIPINSYFYSLAWPAYATISAQCRGMSKTHANRKAKGCVKLDIEADAAARAAAQAAFAPLEQEKLDLEGIIGQALVDIAREEGLLLEAEEKRLAAEKEIARIEEAIAAEIEAERLAKIAADAEAERIRIAAEIEEVIKEERRLLALASADAAAIADAARRERLRIRYGDGYTPPEPVQRARIATVNHNLLRNRRSTSAGRKFAGF